jgi:hypothetical protein
MLRGIEDREEGLHCGVIESVMNSGAYKNHQASTEAGFECLSNIFSFEKSPVRYHLYNSVFKRLISHPCHDHAIKPRRP